MKKLCKVLSFVITVSLSSSETVSSSLVSTSARGLKALGTSTIYKQNPLLFLHSMQDNSKEFTIGKQSLLIPSRLHPLSVTHDTNDFYIIKKDKKFKVQNHSLHKNLRGISQGNLRKLLSHNFYLDVGQASDGEYLLDAKGRLEGGGPILAATFYWTTKVLCYGGLAVIVGTTGLISGKGYLIKNEQLGAPTGDGPAENLGEAVQQGGIASSITAGILSKTGITAAIESLAIANFNVGMALFVAP